MRSSSSFEMEMNSWLPRVLSCLGDWSGPVSMRLQVAFLLSLHLRSALSCGLLWPPVGSFCYLCQSKLTANILPSHQEG